MHVKFTKYRMYGFYITMCFTVSLAEINIGEDFTPDTVFDSENLVSDSKQQLFMVPTEHLKFDGRDFEEKSLDFHTLTQHLDVPHFNRVVNLDLILTQETEVVFAENEQTGVVSFELNATDPYGIGSPGTTLYYDARQTGEELTIQVHVGAPVESWLETSGFLVVCCMTLLIIVLTTCLQIRGQQRHQESKTLELDLVRGANAGNAELIDGVRFNNNRQGNGTELNNIAHTEGEMEKEEEESRPKGEEGVKRSSLLSVVSGNLHQLDCLRPQKAKSLPVPMVIATSLVLMIVLVYAGKSLTAKQTLKVKIPKDTLVRKVRSYSENPSLKAIVMEQDSMALVNQLQLVGVTDKCNEDLSTCEKYAVCNTLQGALNCRCKRGYYVHEKQCKACATSCPDGYFMVNQCSANRDVVCQACTTCSGSQYTAAPCSSTQDAICLDVTFPVDHVNWNASVAEADDGTCEVSTSSNVFVEKLKKMKDLDITLFFTNNQQFMEFPYERESGLEVKVKVSQTFLVPEYVDLEHLDETDFFMRDRFRQEESKRKMKTLQDNYCRSVIPDHYKIILEIQKDQYTTAKLATCDPTSGSPCPQSYKKGDIFLDRDIYTKCPHNDGKGDNFTDLPFRPNAIFCPLPNELLTETFGLKPSETEELRFPTPECNTNENHCQGCVESCQLKPEGERGSCCETTCYSQDICLKAYSDDCPVKPVQCSRGDVYAYYIEPVFESLDKKFMCHLQYRKPSKLYQIEYEVFMPSIGHTLIRKIHTVKPENKTFHEHGSARSDFIVSTHKTLPHIYDEVILVGNRFRDNAPTKFTLHKLKTSEEFDERKRFRVRPHRADIAPKNIYSTHAQFERPFLYSSITWNRGGCFSKNFSQIYPPQHLYTSNGIEIEPTIIQSGGQFVYQAAEEAVGKVATINIFISGNSSILPYFQDDYRDTKVLSSSVRGELTWIKETERWNFSVSGTLAKCPGLLTMDVYDQFMEAHVGHYDVFIKCPVSFTISNTIQRKLSVSPQIFVVYLRDYFTTHKVVLTNMLGPTELPLEKSPAEKPERTNQFPWFPIIFSLIFTGIVLIFFLLVAIYISKIKIVTTDDVFNYPGVTFINKEDERVRLDSTSSAVRAKPISKKIKCVLLILYVMYAFMFTFSMMLGVIYMVQGPLISNLNIVSNTSAKIQAAVDTKLHKIEKFEREEITRLLNETYDRLRACAYHNTEDVQKVASDIQNKVDAQISSLYLYNKTFYSVIKQTLQEKSDILKQELDTFMKDYNQTIQNHFGAVLTNYTKFLKKLMKNDWLKFPEEIFINQKEVLGDNSGMAHLLNFMSWLEVEKVEDTLGVANKLIDRLSRTLPHLDGDPSFENFPSKLRRDALDDLTNQMTAHNFNVLEEESVQVVKLSVSSNGSERTKTNVVIQSKASLINNMKEILFPVFICVFILMDILMLAYRFSWLRGMFQKAKMGVEEKVATDPVAGKIHFTLTGNDTIKSDTSSEKSFSYLMDSKSEVFTGKKELFLMYCRASPKAKEDVLREIWTQKQRQKQKSGPPPSEETSLNSKATKLSKFLYKHLISPIFWRFVLVGAFVLVIAVVIKATNDLVTIETATFLMDTKSIFPQLHRQTAITNTLLSDFVSYSNKLLLDSKQGSDADLNLVNSVLRSSLQKQNQVVQSQVTELCTMSGISLCYMDLALPMFHSSLLQCNFLPLHVNFLPDFHDQSFLLYLHTELHPLVQTLREIVFNMCYILFAFACLMLICHIFIRVIIFYLIKTNRLPKAVMYLVSNANDCWKAQNCHPPDSVYRSNSLIESCESGVVGDIDDHCLYRDPATLVSTERRM